MSSEEVLKRLSEHGRGSLIHFTKQDGDSVVLDLTSDDAQANFDLVKKIKSKVRTGTKGDDHYREVETEIEIHDAQSALKTLALHHKLLTEKHELTGADGGPLELAEAKSNLIGKFTQAVADAGATEVPAKPDAG